MQEQQRKEEIDIFQVKGDEVEFCKRSVLFNVIFWQIVPIVSSIVSGWFDISQISRVIALFFIYFISLGRWTLAYHCLLHNCENLSSKLDAFVGSLAGIMLFFDHGKVGHDYHHSSNYLENLCKRIRESFEHDLEEAERQCEKEVAEFDPDFEMYNAKSELQRFWRCLFFDIKYILFYMRKKKMNWTDLKWDRILVRALIIITPFIVSLQFPTFLSLYTCFLHLILCRIVMSFVFMAFTTYAHIDGLFNKLFKYHFLQKWIDINLVLEILIGHHVHHINDHDMHHQRPRRDVSIISRISREWKEQFHHFIMEFTIFKQTFTYLPL